MMDKGFVCSYLCSSLRSRLGNARAHCANPIWKNMIKTKLSQVSGGTESRHTSKITVKKPKSTPAELKHKKLNWLEISILSYTIFQIHYRMNRPSKNAELDHIASGVTPCVPRVQPMLLQLHTRWRSMCRFKVELYGFWYPWNINEMSF